MSNTTENKQDNFRNHMSIDELVIKNNATIKRYPTKDGKEYFRCGTTTGYVAKECKGKALNELGYVEVKAQDGKWIPCLVCYTAPTEEYGANLLRQ